MCLSISGLTGGGDRSSKKINELPKAAHKVDPAADMGLAFGMVPPGEKHNMEKPVCVLGNK